jgi:hypothetical protein
LTGSCAFFACNFSNHSDIIVYHGYSKDFFSRLAILGGFNINIISVIITLIFKVSGFKGKCSAPYIAIKLRITTANVSTPEKTDKVIDLTANKSGVSFSITGNDTDGNKFSLSGATLTFKATDFKDQGDNNTYYVKTALFLVFFLIFFMTNMR